MSIVTCFFLAEELEIDQAHLDMAVHRAVEKSSINKLSFIRGEVYNESERVNNASEAVMNCVY